MVEAKKQKEWFSKKDAADYLNISERELDREIGNMLFFPKLRLDKYRALKAAGKTREIKRLRNS